MGEGWGEGEYNVISVAYAPFPLPTLLPSPTSGGGKRKKTIVALPPGEGKSDFQVT